MTGGAGFIGSHLVDRLLASGAAKVTVVDNLFIGTEENLSTARVVHGEALQVRREDAADFGAMAALCEEYQPDVVFNLATKALLYSFFNPAGAYRVNTEIALTLAELLRRSAYGKLVHLSSSEVYGTAQRSPMDEDHPLLAQTTYAAGKASADLAFAAYGRMYHLPIMIARPFNNYGPRQNSERFGGVVPLTMKAILAGRPPVLEGDGAQTRDFIFVLDTVDALLRLSATDVPSGTVLNFGSGIETSIRSIIETVAALLGWRGPVEHRPGRPADVHRHVADVSRAEGLIGPIATTPLEVGLRYTADWYRKVLA